MNPSFNTVQDFLKQLFSSNFKLFLPSIVELFENSIKPKNILDLNILVDSTGSSPPSSCKKSSSTAPPKNQKPN